MLAITRWDPYRGMNRLHNQIDRLFGDSLPGWAAEEGTFSPWTPPVEIVEKPETLVVKAEVPGMNQKDIEVHVENGVLTIKGEKKHETETNEKDVHRSERYYGSFVRSFTLPTTVDVEKIRAAYKDGVLEVVLPKAETAKAKRITIGA